MLQWETNAKIKKKLIKTYKTEVATIFTYATDFKNEQKCTSAS